MRFLLDANIIRSLGRYLESLGHETRALAGTPDHNLPDEAVLELAFRERRILITSDKDFGNLVYVERLPHCGVVLFRLADEAADAYWAKMKFALDTYGEKLHDHFTVITDHHLRFR